MKNEDELKDQLSIINEQLKYISDRLTNIERIQTYQSKDLSYHIKRTNALEDMVVGFEEKYQNAINILNDSKMKMLKTLDEINEQQSKKLLTFLSFITPILYIVFEIIKHFFLQK